MGKENKYKYVAFSWELEPKDIYITTDELKEEAIKKAKQKGGAR